MKTVIGIPARMGASRFPGKPLCKIMGKTMIEHVYMRCKLAKKAERVFVAACDQVVKDEVERFGGEVIMTDPDIERPGLRVAAAARNLGLGDRDIVVVAQGDEPLLHPDMIDLAIAPLQSDPGVLLGTLVAQANQAEWLDTNEVKVLVDKNWDILYMTRSSVPSNTRNEVGPRYKQVAVMPFRAPFLQAFNELAMMPYEKVESIELLRAIEHGIKVKAILSPYQSVSVDTEHDRAEAEELMKSDKFFQLYR